MKAVDKLKMVRALVAECEREYAEGPGESRKAIEADPAYEAGVPLPAEALVIHAEMARARKSVAMAMLALAEAEALIETAERLANITHKRWVSKINEVFNLPKERRWVVNGTVDPLLYLVKEGCTPVDDEADEEDAAVGMHVVEALANDGKVRLVGLEQMPEAVRKLIAKALVDGIEQEGGDTMPLH